MRAAGPSSGWTFLLAALGAVLAAPAAAAGPGAVWPEPALSDRLVAYELDAVLDPSARTVAGELQIRWRNPAAEPLDVLYLRLTPNAFAHGATTFHREAKGRFRRPFRTPGPEDWGWIDLSAVRVFPGGAVLTPTCVAPDDGNPDDCTVAALALPAPVAPGASVELSLGFSTRLPRPVARSGMIDGFALLGHWFPRVGRFDPAAGRWRIHQQHAATEFHADFGTFDVTLEVPDGWDAAGTGREVEATREGGRIRRRFLAADVHDFALVISRELVAVADRYERADGSGVDLLLRLPAERAARAPAWLDLARTTLAALERRLGRYPYPQLVLFDPPRGAEETGAMEYPGVVGLGEGSRMPGRTLPPAVLVAHELAHQWFMGMLASDEAEEAWLDEGLATHVAGLVVDVDLGRVGRPAVAVAGATLFELPLPYRWPDVARVGLLGGAADPIHQPAWRFPGLEAYGKAVYLKADLVLSTGRGLAGEETWDRVLAAYARRYRFAHPTADDFLAVVGEEAGPGLPPLLSTLLLGDGVLDLSIDAIEVEDLRLRPPGAWPRGDGTRELVAPRSAQARAAYCDRLAGGRFRTLVTVRRQGPPVPATVRVRFADGSFADARWEGQGSVERLAFVRPVPAVSASVDPDRRIALDRDRANDTREVEPSRLPAVRWAAFVLAALETALSLIGGFP